MGERVRQRRLPREHVRDGADAVGETARLDESVLVGEAPGGDDLDRGADLLRLCGGDPVDAAPVGALRLRATRIYDMVRDRGYVGAVTTVRRYVAEVLPPPRREVYLHTEPLVGEQAQVDWAYVGKLAVPGGVA